MGRSKATAAPTAHLPEILLLAATLGAFAGALLCAFDAAYHSIRLQSFDALINLSFGAVPGAFILLALTILLALGFAVVGFRATRCDWAGLLAGLGAVGFVTSVVLVATGNYRNGLGLLVILGSIPAGGILWALIANHLTVLERPGMAIVWAVSALLGLVIWCGGSAALYPVTGAGWGGAAAGACAALVVLGAVWASRRAVRPTLLVTSLLLMGAVALFGIRRPAAGVGIGAAAPQRSDGPPNIVLIVLDTTRRDFLGCYGNPGKLTPVLDALAAEAVVYEDAISPGSWTPPAHASIFTGFHPVTHGCSHEHHLWLDEDFVTLAEMLDVAGYQTVALNSNRIIEECNLLQGFSDVISLEGPYDKLKLHSLASVLGWPEAWVDKGSAEGCDSLKSWLIGKYDRRDPVFVFVNLLEAHAPYIPPRSARAAHLPEGTSYLEATRFGMQFDPIVAMAIGRTDRYARAVTTAMYRAAVAYQDRRLGDLLQLLDGQLDPENTLLIITADHGEHLGKGGNWTHQYTVNDALIHVPLIIRYPRLFPAGAVYDVLEVDCPVPGLPGRSLVPEHFVARQETFAQVSPDPVFLPMIVWTHGFEVGVREFNNHLRAIRTDRHKYVWSSGGDHRLFDVVSDPFEEHNLVESAPEIAAELQQRLISWFASQPRYVPKAPSNEGRALDQEAIERLRNLGYVGE